MSKCTKTRLQASLIPNFSRGERIPNRLCGVRVFAHRASACCINFDESYDHWMRTLLIRLSTLLFVACGLLQQSAGRVSKVHDQQATTDRECSSATYFVLCTCYSSIGVYHLCCTTICTRSTFRSVSTTNWTLLNCALLLAGKAPRFQVDCCTPVSEISGRRQLRSTRRQHLTVPRYRLSTFGCRSCFVELFTWSSPWSNSEFWQF